MPEAKRAADPLLVRLMEAYGRAWETRDADLVVSLFTEDATYHENPFNEPIRGHDGIRRYWQQATGPHRDVRFRWSPLFSSGSLHGIEWSSEYTRADSGRRFELRGAMIVELRSERIAHLREYWMRQEK